ncbi:MAG: UDP-N-acetylmuramoyl-L-alanine--D-glutamate ligase [Thermoleophilia bacterium]|nr:UDP-N-acetylmuramoyl-L-alanine--D-glutamate ligase [Thermoleophilia bacterium]
MNRAPDLKIDRLLVAGMGRSGVAAAGAARRMLPQADILLSDRQEVTLDPDTRSSLQNAGVRIEAGRDDAGLLDGCGLVIKSPGVPADVPLLTEARRRGIPVWGEVEFALRFLPNPMVGVTGTNGKTTTTELIGHILRGAGRPCRVAGNVGTALSTLAGRVEARDILVVELSSFQLEDSVLLRPDIAVLLNLTEDHMDRHHGPGPYFAAKTRIFANQRPQDLAVINLDDPNCRRPLPGSACQAWFSRGSGDAAAAAQAMGIEPLVTVRDGVIVADMAALAAASGDLRGRLPEGGRKEPPGGEISRRENTRRRRGGPVEIVAWEAASLKGEHNLDNSLAATAVSIGLGLGPGEVAAGLRSFPGVRHRLQEVRTVDGVRYVDDSKATNADAAIKALTAFPGGIHLILGGSLKGCSFDRLAAAAAGRVREVILIGEAAAEISASFERQGFPGQGGKVIMAGRLEDAVKIASGNAVPGDVVLLSPACASFDQYRDFEERGEHFISLVSKIGKK